MSCGFYAFVSLSLSLLFFGTVVQALSWKTVPSNKTIAKGGNVKLFCEINSRVNETVIWSKEGDAIFVNNVKMSALLTRYSLEGNFNLVISNVQESDAAKFTCTVQNLGTKTAHLDVQVQPNAPAITVNDTTLPYLEGDKIMLTCTSSGGNPAPTFVWKKQPKDSPEADIPSGHMLLNQETPRPRGTSSSQIVVAMDYTDHEAVYRCYVNNILNVDSPLSDSVEFRVLYKPRVTFRPFSLFNIQLGNNYELECVVNANPAVNSVIWRKGSNILQGTSKIRRFNNAQKSDSGEYSCTASNAIDGQTKSDTKSIQVNVLYAPIITVPKSFTANVSGLASLECIVDANPKAYLIRWTKIDNSVQSVGKFLNISNIQVSQMGNYSCVAKNRLELSGQVGRDEMTRAYSMLYVQYKPGDASLSRYTPVKVGGSLSLKCSVNDPGYPAPRYRWTRVGSDEELLETSSTLSKSSLTLGDIGNYSCAAYNVMGQGRAAIIFVDIYEVPTIVTHPSDKVIIYKNDTNFSFHCKVHGRPKPRILWYKDGTPLGQYGDIYTVTEVVTSVDTHSYLVTSTVALQGQSRSSASRDSLLLQDIGNYTCLAVSNETGTQDSHTLQLLILFPPKTDNHQKVASNLNHTAFLTCITEGYPIPRFQWYKGASLLSTSGRFQIHSPEVSGPSKATSILKISRVDITDFGDYSCVVDNSQGSAEKTIALVVKNKPEAPSQLAVSSKTWESVYLTWRAGFDGGEPQTFYIHYASLPHAAHGANDVEVVPSGANRFNVTGLIPSVTYDFRVYGVNRLGVGNQSRSLKIATEVLPFPRIKAIPVFDVENKKLKLDININNTYCLRIKVSQNGGSSWTTIIVKNIDCFDLSDKSYSVPKEGVNKVNVSLCLRARQDVCGSHVSAEIRAPSNPDLTATEVIAIGCVCAAILLALLGVLIYIICRRRQRNSKEYQNAANANHPPQPVNGSSNSPAKPKRGLDNPGMAYDGTLYYSSREHDFDSHVFTSASSSGLPVYTNQYHSGPNPTIYPSHLYNQSNGGHNGLVSNGSIPLDTSYDSQLEKRLYENEMNRRNANMSNNGFSNTSPQGTPRKDPQQFINLPHDDSKGEGGSIQSGLESGYSTPDPAKPKNKKYRGKNLRNGSSSFYCDQDHFAHDPPGHTCGLPCCNSDLRVHMKLQSHHSGCMAIPFLQRKIIQDNFTLRNNQRNLIKGVPTFTSGFFSVQPERALQRKPLPKFSTVRRQNVIEQTSKIQTMEESKLDHEPSQNQYHYIKGREITLPRIQSQCQETSPVSIHTENFENNESLDTDFNDSSSDDTDTGYYTSIASITKEDIGNKGVSQRLIYPWDMLKSCQNEGKKQRYPDEHSVYYDTLTDTAYKKRQERVDIGKQLSAPCCTEINRKTISLIRTNTDYSSTSNNQTLDTERNSKSLQKIGSYCTLNFDNNLFNKSKIVIPSNFKNESSVTPTEDNGPVRSTELSDGKTNQIKCFDIPAKKLNEIQQLVRYSHHPNQGHKRYDDVCSDLGLPKSSEAKSQVSHKLINTKHRKQPQVPDSFLHVEFRKRNQTQGNEYVPLCRERNTSEDHVSGDNEGEYTLLTIQSDNSTVPEVKNNSNKLVTFSIDGECTLKMKKCPSSPPSSTKTMQIPRCPPPLPTRPTEKQICHPSLPTRPPEIPKHPPPPPARPPEIPNCPPPPTRPPEIPKRHPLPAKIPPKIPKFPQAPTFPKRSSKEDQSYQESNRENLKISEDIPNSNKTEISLCHANNENCNPNTESDKIAEESVHIADHQAIPVNSVETNNMNDLSQHGAVKEGRSALILKLKNIDVCKISKGKESDDTDDRNENNKRSMEQPGLLSTLLDEVSRDAKENVDNPITLIM